MSEDPPRLDRFGDEVPPASSPLLFVHDEPEEEAPIGYEDLPPEPAPQRSMAGYVVGGLTAVLVLAIAGTVMSGSGGAEEEPIDVARPEAPPVTTGGLTRIAPFPSGELEGAVHSSMPVGVRVTRASGGAVADTTVRFEVDAGIGVLELSTVRTSREGIAVTRLTLPPRPGTTVIRASVDGSETAIARVLVTATPSSATTFQGIGGSGQEDEIGEILPARVQVRMTDEDGNPVPNASVEFAVVQGGGIVAPSRTRTDTLGIASARWRLGMEAGAQLVEATAPDLEVGVISFSANGLPRTSIESSSQPRIESQPVTVAPRTYAVGGEHVCELQGGGVLCRGSNTRGQTSGAGGAGFIFLAAGASHTCALSRAGEASCWGANDSGQLGDGTREDRAQVVRVASDLRFSVLAAGASHTCGLAGGGTPLCWGRNLSGQLGDGSRNDQAAPRMVGGGITFVDLVAGWDHTCGLTSSGNTFCWGLNQSGQLGDGSRLDHLEPTSVRGSVETLVAGAQHTCGISRGEVLCWGGNAGGQLGTGDRQDHPSPTVVGGLPGLPTALAAGAVHTCALVEGGRAFCWGQNRNGQLGTGNTTAAPAPVEVSGGLRFTSITAGGAQTCGRATDGVDYCWGLNQGGQLGDGTRANRSTPTAVQR